MRDRDGDSDGLEIEVREDRRHKIGLNL